MIPWIQVYSNLPHHPKTARLADELGLNNKAVGVDTVAVGIVVSLWTWAMQNAYTGDLSGVSDRTIAEACRFKGDPSKFVSALTAAGFLDADRRIHDWEEYAAQIIDAEDNRKANDRERAKKYRDKKRDASRDGHVTEADISRDASRDNPVTSRENHAPTIPYHTIPDINEESVKGAPAGARVIPDYKKSEKETTAGFGEKLYDSFVKFRASAKDKTDYAKIKTRLLPLIERYGIISVDDAASVALRNGKAGKAEYIEGVLRNKGAAR